MKTHIAEITAKLEKGEINAISANKLLFELFNSKSSALFDSGFNVSTEFNNAEIRDMNEFYSQEDYDLEKKSLINQITGFNEVDGFYCNEDELLIDYEIALERVRRELRNDCSKKIELEGDIATMIRQEIVYWKKLIKTNYLSMGLIDFISNMTSEYLISEFIEE